MGGLAGLTSGGGGYYRPEGVGLTEDGVMGGPTKTQPTFLQWGTHASARAKVWSSENSRTS